MNHSDSHSTRTPQTTGRVHLLRHALPLIGITAPTFYRWIRTGRIEDYRIRGSRGETYLSESAIEKLREEATFVEYVTT
jgi:predicted site-specific integrase-resolvase